MKIDQILKELDIISGSRKRDKKLAKSKMVDILAFIEEQNKMDFKMADILIKIIAANYLSLIEEKLEALNKTLLYISKKDE